MFKLSVTLSFLMIQILCSCNKTDRQRSETADSINLGTSLKAIDGEPVYESENLSISKISEHVYQHISYLNTESFGRVACNGMIVVNENEAVVFDTPTDDDSARELIDYLTEEMNCKVNGVVATHFHLDCVGGIDAFHKSHIPSYASDRTIELLKTKSSVPQKSFKDSLELNVGDQKVYAQFVGEGHTKDNIIGYFPADKIMFGGCLIKEIGGSKGNLEDANVTAWSETVRQVRSKYPQTFVVIPGHGKAGGQELLDYTANLFSETGKN